MATTVTALEELNTTLVNNKYVVVDFWADWSKPCLQMNQIIDQLATQCPKLKFLKIEAEKVSEISIKFDIKSVPAFFFMKDGIIEDQLIGADPSQLTMKAIQFHTQASGDSSVTSNSTTNNTTSNNNSNEPLSVAQQPSQEVLDKIKKQQEEEKIKLNERLEKLVNQAPVMLFMKGSPDQPACGFSNKTVAILRKDGFVFDSFNILDDMAVRNGLKEYSNWPTYPQLYIDGKLVGGFDIIKELHEEGELASMKP
ncbi:glutaredoxin family protein [Cavenderia fasciculata]|uniref:Glutaredoxin family protein n=1 Tax=Cavenderia fasciculata TaxID=261658 RepID=F4Q0W1_CACFS|nr:glutaredoxin family protein [Cavenderia fasciculata]EGG18462.1 glutaredoxin family protein [Cavenderia fasciculata]|eukprot:XP_004366366.1 glutaredoxin family protein [Cavenderia fasciculata]